MPSNNKTLTVRRVVVAHKLDIADALLFDLRLSEVINLLPKNLTLSEAYWRIFEKGIDTIEAEAQTGQGENFELVRQARILDERESKTALLSMLYEKMGASDFMKFCEEKNINADDFLSSYTLILNQRYEEGAMSWTDRAVKWLGEFLQAGDKEAEEVRTAALEAKIINPDQWNNLKVVACRAGFTKSERRGVWRAPSIKKQDEPF